MGDEHETVRGGTPRAPDATPTVDRRKSDAPRAPQPAAGAPSAFDPAPDRFRTVGELGRGGMGRVADAYDRALGRSVAIKHMLSDASVDLSRFEREARITARLEHPGIVPIHDAGRGPDGTPFYVMRRVDGRPLDGLVAGKTLAERLALIPNILAACDAAAYAHARKIVHRDIKPTNILVGPFGETLLIDWGLARAIDDADAPAGGIAPSDPQLTRAGTVAGTPGFMAPEQARGEAVDARADVFALGATLFYVLAGQQPYGGVSATEMVGLAGEGRAPAWHLVPRDVPRDLRAIAMKAMAGAADARYPDAGALAADLRRFVTGNLVGAYEYGALARVARFVRRHRAAVAVAAVSAVALGVLATISVRRIVTERDDANAARRLAETRQREATDTADEMLVAHARELLASDPTAAIQQLRRLDPSSSHWSEAATIAQGAALRGISFGFAAGATDAISIGPDDRTLIIAPLRHGTVSIIDLVTRTRRTLPVTGAGVDWFDARHAVFDDGEQLVELDLATLHTRSRPMPNNQLQCWSGRCFVMNEGALSELTSFDAAPVPIATGVTSFDHDTYVRTAAHGLEVVTPAGHFTLAGDASNTFTSDGVLVVPDGSKVDVYRLDHGAPDKLGTFDLRGITTGAAVVGDAVYACGSGGVWRLRPGSAIQIVNIESVWMAVARQRDRLVFPQTGGGIVVIEDGVSWRTGDRPAQLMRAALSGDGRFVVAHADSGEVQVLDLDSFGPHVYPGYDTDEHVLGISPHTVWTYGPMAVIAYDRATWQRKVVVDVPGLVTGGAIGAHDSLIVASSTVPPGLGWWLIDTATGAVISESHTDPPLPYSVQPDRVLVASTDGGIDALTHAAGVRRTRIASFAPGFIGFDVGPGVAAAAYPDGTIERLELATQRRTRVKVPGELEQLTVDQDDVVWLLASHAPWTWRPGGVPAKLPFAHELDDLVMCPSGVVGRAPSAIFLLDRTPIRTIAMHADVDPAAFGSFHGCFDGRSWLGTENQLAGRVELADLTNGVTFEIPSLPTADSTLVVAADSIWQVEIADKQAHLLAWPLRVPSDPAALRAWFSTVTNAVPVPNSDAVVWP